MTPERWQRVKEIFHGAVELDPAGRALYLRENCGGDEELEKEVESLLASDQNFDSLLDRPIVEAGAMAAAAPIDAFREDAAGGSGLGTRVLNSRYEIERELGRGGMSVVYLARDRQLLAKRVVVKVLLAETNPDPWFRQKFLQEMEALTRIDHPGVVGVLDSGLTSEGRRFLVMQYIEGVTLRSLIVPGGMNVARASGIIRQTGQALAAAHEKGVWHRDLKPENIMLQHLAGGDHVKLIDFGIAGIQDSQFTGEKTRVAGTLSYMAPEQLSGQASAATDTYALGVVAYEILTGILPEDSKEPTPKLPEAAEKSVRKAMSARPELRHPGVREFSEELCHALTGVPPHRPLAEGAPKGTWRNARFALVAVAMVAAVAAGALWFGRDRKSPPPLPETPSIAVLPFADNSPANNQEYFSDGLTEELLNALAAIPGLRVTGRTSSFQFKGKTEDLHDIGKKLNVSTILEGSVSRQGSRTKVTTRLIKVSDGFLIWSSTFDREMNDIFAVQEEIGRAVAGALKVTLLPDRITEPFVTTTNADAYNAYLQGRYFLRRNDKEGLDRAVSYFEQAIQTDPRYAPAWVGIAEAHTNQFNSGHIPADEGYRQARTEIETALTLNASLGEAYAALGRIRMLHDWDWTGADGAYQRALSLEPGKSGVISQCGNLARILGRFNEAAALGRRAMQIDPLIPGLVHNAGLAFYYAGLNEEAAAAFRKALELAPERETTHSLMAAVYLLSGKPREALVEAGLEKNDIFKTWSLSLAYRGLQRKTESDTSLAQLVTRFQTEAPYQIAEVYGFRGETERAFDWLDRAYAERDSGIAFVKGDPLLQSLKGAPRYTAILSKLRLP